MADGISTATQKLTREQIAAVVGNNPRAIKLFENLLADVSSTLPDAIVESELSARYSLQAADGSKSNSFNALRLGEEIEVLLMAVSGLKTQVHALQRQVDDLRALAQGV